MWTLKLSVDLVIGIENSSSLEYKRRLETKFVNGKVTKCYDNKEVPRMAHQNFT